MDGDYSPVGLLSSIALGYTTERWGNTLLIGQSADEPLLQESIAQTKTYNKFDNRLIIITISI